MNTNTKSDDAFKNYLLASMSAKDFATIESKLEPVSLELGEVLYESGEEAKYLYFPTTATISMLYVMENGATIEVGMVGNDGVVGIALFMGGSSTPSRAVIHNAGNAFRMTAKQVRKEFERGNLFQQLLLRFTQALITQIAQNAVCNRLHTVDKQLCRWLLFSHDRLESDDLLMTHDLVASMLGVRREAVSLALKKLVKRDLIGSSRGRISIIDRQGLESIACECYAIVSREYNRLLGRGISRTFN